MCVDGHEYDLCHAFSPCCLADVHGRQVKVDQGSAFAHIVVTIDL